MRYRPAVLALCVSLVGAPAAAQFTLAPGARVRVLPADSVAIHVGDRARGWVVGTLVSSPPPALVLETPSGQLRYTVDAFRQVEASRGRADRRTAWAIVGGVLSGAAFTGAVCAFSDGSCRIGSHLGGFLAYYAVGAIPGAIVGGALGSRRVGDERWSRVWPTP